MAEASREGRVPGVMALVFGRYADYVWGLRPLFLLCLLLFVFSLAMGLYLGDRVPGEALDEVLEMLPAIENLSPLTLFLFIVVNNVIKSFLWMVLGVIFSLPSLFFIILNGFLIGWFSYSVQLEHGLPFTAAALIPHGIIEIPTILLSSAAGMGLGYQMINLLRKRSGLRAEFKKALSLFIWRIAPLLILAAVVEMTVTPVVVSLVSLR